MIKDTGVLKTIIKLHKLNIGDTESLDKILLRASAIKHKLIIYEVLSVIATIILITLVVSSNTTMTSLRGFMNKEFKELYTADKIVIQTDIQTATVQSFENGILVTDLGVIEVFKKPRASRLIVYSDIDDKIQPIENINSSNELNHSTFEYVGTDYKERSNELLLKTEYERLKYKDYIKYASQLNKNELKNNIYIIVMIASLLVTSYITSILVLLIIGIRKVGGQQYSPKIALSGSPLSDTKHVVNIEKRGIGSTGKVEASDGRYRDSEDAVFNEGGFFTGRKDKEKEKDKER